MVSRRKLQRRENVSERDRQTEKQPLTKVLTDILDDIASMEQEQGTI